MRYSQDWTPSPVFDGGAKVPSQPPSGIEEPKTTSKQESSNHTPQHQQRAAGKVPAETGKGVTSTLVFPADSKIETSRSETQRTVVSHTTVMVRQLSPGEGSTAADPTRSFPSAKTIEETGKEGHKEEPVLATPKPGTAEVDAAIAKSRISKSPAHGLAESTTDVGTTVYAVTSELLSGAPQQPTDKKALEEHEKERANGHPKHLELQKKESPLPSVTVTKTLPGQHDVHSEKPTPLSETGKEPVGKPLLSQPQPDQSTPLLASETGKPTDPEGEEIKATGDDVPANGEPKHLKKSSKKKKKDHSPSPAPQVQDTKTSSNPLDRFGKKVKKFAMNLFSGDSKHSSEVIPTDDAKKEQPVQPDGETKKDKKKKSKKKSKAPLPEELAPVMPTRAETDSNKHDTVQPALLTETDRLQAVPEDSNTTLATTGDITPADVSRELVMPHDDSKQPHSVPTSLVLDAETPRVTPGSAQIPHGVTPGVQSDKSHGVETDATIYTVGDSVTAGTSKNLQKSSHHDIIGVADIRTAISDGSKPQLQEDKKHKGKKKKGHKEKATGLDDQLQHDRQQDMSKSDKPKEAHDEQGLKKYSQVLVTEETSVVRSSEYIRHTDEKTPKVPETTIRGHHEVPKAGGNLPDTSDFNKPGQNEQQPHLIDEPKKKPTELESHSTQPISQDYDEEHLISELTDIIRECRKEHPKTDLQSSPQKQSTSAIFGWKESPDKLEPDDQQLGKKTKGKPTQPSNKPQDHKKPETMIITEVTRIIQEGDKVPAFPGEFAHDTQEPTKLRSREGTPGKETTTTIFGWKETPEKPEADDKEPRKKKKGKPKKPSDEPHDQKEPESVIITEVTRIIQEGDKLPGFPGEPMSDTKEPTKLPSREGTPGKEPTTNIFGWKETSEKPEADDKEPGKKKKGKPKKPSDEPHDQNEPGTVIITEMTHIIQEERAHLEKEPTTIIFGWKETPEKPEADDKEPGKKKKGKPKKPSDEPHDQKEPETVIITEVTRIIQEGDKLPGFPGEPLSDTQEPTKLPSREGTPGKEPTTNIFGWKETSEKPEADDKEPGKKKKGKPKKPSDEPHDQKEPETVIITEMTRIIQEGDKLPGFPGEPLSDTQEPTKLPSREGTPGKEPTTTIFGWKETPEKPEAYDKEPGKKKKGKPKKPSDEPHEPERT
ncbi:hypothetical protein MTO96_015700 [Rhipicephalus appendiculatus]